MSFQEDFMFWRLAHYFISKHEYRIIQLSKNHQEIWLEKLEDKGSAGDSHSSPSIGLEQLDAAGY